MHRHAVITAPPGQGYFVIRILAAQTDNESIEAACAVRHILFEAVQYPKTPLSKSDSADLSPLSIEPGDLES
jgi:hypothetical protein